MPLNDSNSWVCAGAKRISIAEKGVPPTDGMVSVFCRPPSNDDCAPDDDRGSSNCGRRSPANRLSGGRSCSDDCLHVVITDGAHTFYESIASKDIRYMTCEEGEELETVTSILLHPDDETFKVSYKRVEWQLVGGSHDSKNTTSVGVSIRKTCLNNVVRPVWEGEIDNIFHSCYDDLPLFARNALPGEVTETESSSSGLAFSIMVGNTINKLHGEIDALRKRNKELEINTLRWKSTADKLSNQWETEKSELTDRFLTLFNEHKARHVETRKELDRLKGKRQRTERIGETARDDDDGRSSRTRTGRELLPDDEDEHDYADYDDKMVARLAAGPGVTRRRAAGDRNPTTGRKVKRENSESQGGGFVNPHTGAMEFDNPKELFSSSSEDEDIKK